MSPFLLFLFLSSLLACKAPDMPFKQRFPGLWRITQGSEDQLVGQALVQNDVTGCGEYYVIRSMQEEGEFLVTFTSDGDNWRYYIVETLYGHKVTPTNAPSITPPDLNHLQK